MAYFYCTQFECSARVKENQISGGVELPPFTHTRKTNSQNRIHLSLPFTRSVHEIQLLRLLLPLINVHILNYKYVNLLVVYEPDNKL